MRKAYMFFVCLMLASVCMPVVGWAQKGRSVRVAAGKGKAKNTKDNKRKEEVKPEVDDPLTPQLLLATQRLLVFDSLVVNRSDMLSHLTLSGEQGRITTYDAFFSSKGHKDAMLYVNELGNACIFSRTDKDGHSQLYSSDLLAGKWSEAAPLKGLGDDNRFTQVNYPFLMPDGVTLYFAAKGEETLGGWDLFRTTYDASRGRYKHAESLGLPFCSTDDDLLMVVNETDSVGMLVSNRGQKSGKVCIYFFVPTISHQTYDMDAESPALRQLATLNGISLTWQGQKAERQRALVRHAKARQRIAASGKSQQEGEISFFVRDGLTYTSAKQFRSQDGVKRYWQLVQQRDKLNQLQNTLDSQRQKYAAKRDKSLGDAILQNEQAAEQLERDIRQMEKQLRNDENRRL